MTDETVPACLWPFTSVAIDHQGDVNLCPCVQWTRMKPVGNIRESSLEEIWNSERAVEYRKKFLTREWKSLCNEDLCPYLRDPRKVLADRHLVAPENGVAIALGETELPQPFSRVKLDTDLRCNLECAMCRTELITRPANDVTELALKRLEPHWPSISEISPSSAGEPLFIREVRALLASDVLSQHDVAVELVTNGLLLRDSWDEIRHNRFCAVKVSIDSVDPTRYEELRRRGNFDRLLENLEFLAELRSSGEVRALQLSVVVMRSNFEELPDFVRFARRYGFDVVKFQALNDALVPDEALREDDIRRLREIARDPLCRDPIVDFWSVAGLLDAPAGSGSHP